MRLRLAGLARMRLSQRSAIRFLDKRPNLYPEPRPSANPDGRGFAFTLSGCTQDVDEPQSCNY